jgi:hypothetical protein
MPWFQCFARGENFPGLADAPDQPVGFYANEFVEAPDPESAELCALAALRGRETLIALGGDPAAHRARVYFESIVEVPADAVPDKRLGLVFFPMDGTSAPD